MKLTTTSSEFSDLVACFLYEQVTHPEDSVPVALNPQWAEFVEVLNRKGLRAPLLKYYLSTDPKIRIRWNMIKKTFTDDKAAAPAYIEIRNEHIPVTKAPTVINRVGSIIKKAVGYGAAAISGS
jgi:hypothetical protein